MEQPENNYMAKIREERENPKPSSSSERYEFDDLLRMVGGLGRYPILLYSFMCIMSIPIGLSQLVQVFYGATPAFECVDRSGKGWMTSNDSCGVGKCCTNCTRYDFKGEFTSAVSEVIDLRLSLCTSMVIKCMHALLVITTE